MNVLITGVSSGIGLALARAFIDQGAVVFGTSRREPPAKVLESIRFVPSDLSDFECVPRMLEELLGEVTALDLVWLNAGVLGEIKDMAACSIAELQRTFDINVWANKVVLDALYSRPRDVKEVIAISSGAAIRGNRGWNGYAISKAALNMLIQLYAAERPDTHFIAFAPGLVDTAMQDYLCALPEDDSHPSVEVLKAARGTENMPDPEEAAQRILNVLPRLKTLPSGSFADIRTLKDASP